MTATIPGLRWFFRVSAVLAAIAGIQLVIGAGDTDRFFSWTIEPPLTAAFMGAAYWAACVLLTWAALQRTCARAQLALPPVFTIAVLLLVATLIHLDRFHHDLYGRFWAAVYAIVVPLLAYLIWAQTREPGTTGAVDGLFPAGFGLPSARRPSRYWSSASCCSPIPRASTRSGSGP